jgi:hypothetical protein
LRLRIHHICPWKFVVPPGDGGASSPSSGRSSDRRPRRSPGPPLPTKAFAVGDAGHGGARRWAWEQPTLRHSAGVAEAWTQTEPAALLTQVCHQEVGCGAVQALPGRLSVRASCPVASDERGWLRGAAAFSNLGRGSISGENFKQDVTDVAVMKVLERKRRILLMNNAFRVDARSEDMAFRTQVMRFRQRDQDTARRRRRNGRSAGLRTSPAHVRAPQVPRTRRATPR